LSLYKIYTKINKDIQNASIDELTKREEEVSKEFVSLCTDLMGLGDLDDELVENFVLSNFKTLFNAALQVYPSETKDNLQKIEQIKERFKEKDNECFR